MKTLTIVILLLIQVSVRGYSQDATYRMLQSTYVTLNYFDYALTVNALETGKVKEANPLMKGIAHNRLALAGVKAGSTIGVLLLSDIVHQYNPKTAKWLLVGLNTMMTGIVTNNIIVTIRL